MKDSFPHQRLNFETFCEVKPWLQKFNFMAHNHKISDNGITCLSCPPLAEWQNYHPGEKKKKKRIKCQNIKPFYSQYENTNLKLNKIKLNNWPAIAMTLHCSHASLDSLDPANTSIHMIRYRVHPKSLYSQSNAFQHPWIFAADGF